MSGEPDSDCPPDEFVPRPGAIVRKIRIGNKKGLHARASAKFVHCVEQFEADIRVARCGEVVGGNSIMGLMMLSAAPGTIITVEATGKDAVEAMAAIETLIDSRFGEED